MYKFLIYISHPYSISIGKPLQLEVQKRGYEVFWFSDLEYTKEYLSEEIPLLNSVNDVLNYKPNIILTATDVVPDFFPGIKVQIFHGFSANKRAFKKDHFRIRSLFDLYTTHGPSTTSIFKMLAKKYRTFEVIETGWSKVDPLFPIEPFTKKNKPVILISSTFTTRLSLAKNESVYNEIKRLTSTDKYLFHCVLHPMLDNDTKNKFKALENENFSFFDTTDLIPLFKKADIMFSDTTSAITEFLLQKKPVVTFRNNKPDKHLINITEIKDIEPAIETALNPPTILIDNIQEFINFTHPYFDGRSSERVIDATIDFFTSDKSYLKKKPLNLMRKWKIRKKLKYYTLKSFNKPQTAFTNK